MPTAINTTLSELQFILSHTNLSSEARLKVTFEDEESSIELFKKKKAIEAMRQLKGSGNGNLIESLLKERKMDKLK